ncbi:MAG: nicotinamide riboside transporter PnuC [Prevotellaceae bacterium]|jgi:nicotinamide mononucleotide transporter|nr:nicotinamide riboside transporter PnuC [Prevotellaceae bacterium]
MTFDCIEILGVCFSLLYLFLEIKQRKALWIVGFISSAFYVYIFFQAKFYADMGLNVYYLLASIYGWIVWSHKQTTTAGKQERSIVRLKLLPALVLLGVSGVLFSGLSFVLKSYTDSPVPFGDALTTALSIVATWMLAHKIIEQWWVWLFVNIFSATLYIYRGLYPTAFLFCCYAVASVIGYYSWKKKWNAN